MREVKLDKLKEYIIEPYKDEDFVPLILFRGTMTLGKAKSLLNLVCAFLEAEVLTRYDAVKLSVEGGDINHLCGLHRPITTVGFDGFLARLLACPEVTAKIPHLDEYLGELTQSCRVLKFEKISRYSPWSKRKWRYQYSERAGYKKIVTPQDLESQQALKAPVPTFYPFLTGDPTDEHKLILEVHEAVPHGIPQQWRQDICQDLLIAVLIGDVKRDNLGDSATIQKFVKAAFRQFPSKYGVRSLDRPLSSEDGRTLSEMISEENIIQHW